MLEAIGVGSIDELFEDIPEGLRLGRPARAAGRQARDRGLRPALGAGRAERPRRGRDELPRRRDVRPLRAGDRRRDHRPLGVPDAVHAVPARDLAGRAAGDVRVPDGDVGADRACRSPTPRCTRAPRRSPPPPTWRSAPPAARSWSPRAASTRTAASRSSPTAPATAPSWSRSRSTGGVTDAAALAEAIDDETAAVFLQQPNFLGAVEDIEALAAAAKEKRRAGGRRLRPDRALGPEAARRVRRRRRGRRGPAARQPPRLRRAVVRLLLRDRGAHPPHARPDRRRDHRRRRPARLRPHPADPRAAHPPREGDPQHLHRPGAERAGRDGPPGLARQARLRRARRAAGAAHRLRARGAWRRSTASSCCTRRRWSASSRSTLDAPVDQVLDRCAAEGIGAGYPLGRDYPEHEDGLLVAITERRSRADIDRLAEVARPRRRRICRGSRVAEGVAS